MARHRPNLLKSEKRDAKRKVRMAVHNFGVKSRPRRGVSVSVKKRVNK